MATRRKDIDRSNLDNINNSTLDPGTHRQRVSELYTKRAILRKSIANVAKYNIYYYICVVLYIIYITFIQKYNTFILPPQQHIVIATLLFTYTEYVLLSLRSTIPTCLLYTVQLLYLVCYNVVMNLNHLKYIHHDITHQQMYIHVAASVIHVFGAVVHSFALMHLLALRQLNSSGNIQSSNTTTTATKQNTQTPKGSGKRR